MATLATKKEPQARNTRSGLVQSVASNVRLLGLGGQGCRGDGVAAQPWPNVLSLPCDLHCGCDGRHTESEITTPALSFTTKAAPMSSTDHGGGKRH